MNTAQHTWIVYRHGHNEANQSLADGCPQQMEVARVSAPSADDAIDIAREQGISVCANQILIAHREHPDPIETAPETIEWSEYRIPRDGDRDLSFEGKLLGEGSHGTGGNSGFVKDWTRGTDVEIYRTKGGSYVVSVRQWSRWQGEGEVNRAAICKSPSEVLNWLTDDCGGTLGPASKEAWDAAAGADQGIAAMGYEEVA